MMKSMIISKNRLKINLSAEDLQDLELSYELLDYKDLRIRDIIKELIELACERTGFDADNGRVMIEATPSRGGGCNLYVTKLPYSRNFRKEGASIKNEETVQEPYLFQFENLDNLMDVAARIQKFKEIFLPHTAIYLYKENWFFSFTPTNDRSNLLDHLLGFLSEYATELSGGFAQERLLNEHGKMIAQDAKVLSFFESLWK